MRCCRLELQRSVPTTRTTMVKIFFSLLWKILFLRFDSTFDTHFWFSNIVFFFLIIFFFFLKGNTSLRRLRLVRASKNTVKALHAFIVLGANLADHLHLIVRCVLPMLGVVLVLLTTLDSPSLFSLFSLSLHSLSLHNLRYHPFFI